MSIGAKSRPLKTAKADPATNDQALKTAELGVIMDKNIARVKLESKSMGLGVVLTILFGGLGMFYLSIG